MKKILDDWQYLKRYSWLADQLQNSSKFASELNTRYKLTTIGYIVPESRLGSYCVKMHENNEQTLKRRRTRSGLEESNEKCEETQSDDVADPSLMTDMKTALDNNSNIELTEGDVYTRLSNTEHDLALAKEIGEALLSENIELRDKYESLLEEHATQLEVLRQEKHEVQLGRKRMESIQEEKIRELNVDVENLQNKLTTFEANLRDDKQARRNSVLELMQENSKLQSELNKVKSSNQELLKEINRLRKMQRGQSLNESSDSEVIDETAVLQQKLTVLTEERAVLNASVNQLMTEKHDVSQEVNLLTQKVITLTEELAESKSELHLCEEELNRCRKENNKLVDQLEEVKLQTSQQIALNASSLFSEISLLEHETDFRSKLAASSSCKKLKAVSSLRGTPKPLATSSSMSLVTKQRDLTAVKLSTSSESSEDYDSSFEEILEGDGFVLKQQGFLAQLEDEQNVNIELRKEMCSVCHQLLQACRLITNKEYESKQTSKMDIEELFDKDETGAGTLTMISAEMIGLLKEYIERQENKVSTLEILENSIDSFTKEDQDYVEEKLLSLENKVEDLTTECFEAKKQLASLGMQLEQSRREISENEVEKTKLLEKISTQENVIENFKKSHGRIKACRSKSVVEELEKARRDVQNLDNQLIAAVHQKIQLSEQLEQWQYDMASVIEEQVQKQLNASSDHSKKKTSRLPFMKKGWAWNS